MSTGGCAIACSSTLGREDELKASGQLEQLMGSFARLDPPLAGVRRQVGPLLLAWHFISELDSDRHRRPGVAAARAPAVLGRGGGGGADRQPVVLALAVV